MIMPVALAGRGIARAGDKVFMGDKEVGYDNQRDDGA